MSLTGDSQRFGLVRFIVVSLSIQASSPRSSRSCRKGPKELLLDEAEFASATFRMQSKCALLEIS